MASKPQADALDECERCIAAGSSVEAVPAAEEIELPPGLDSGDVVLFNRRCMSMPIAGAALCKFAKFMYNSEWDHVGIIVRHPTTEELLFLEADFGGVKLRSLKERVRRSKSNEIAVRRLSCIRTPAMRDKLYSFSQRMLGRPYEIGTSSVMARVVDPDAKVRRERNHALLIGKREHFKEIERELKSAALTRTARAFLIAERDRVRNEIKQREQDLMQQFGAIMNDEARNEGSSPSNDLARVFCSELVAAAYQDLGLLDTFPPAGSYNPKDFSSEEKDRGVHLLRFAKLHDEIFVRKQPDRALKQQDHQHGSQERSNKSSTLSVQGIQNGYTPDRDSQRLIRNVLKRTPLYEKVPDEYKWSHLTRSFKARVVEEGEVIFSQGDFDDRIYVIESGAVDRFVTKSEEEGAVLVNSLGSGNSFGLTSFVFNCPRGTTIKASERTLLWSIDKPTFETFKDTNSPIQAIVSDADQRALRGLLSEHFLFRRLDRIGLDELGSFFVVKFRAGETIFAQGDRGDNFYIIKSGEVERHIRHPRPAGTELEPDTADENRATLAKTLWPGQSFGELSLMYNAPRAATVRARTDTECWAISAESFHRLNLGHGTQYLRAIFTRNASVKKKGEPYMTPADLLRFAGVVDSNTEFQDEATRRRLAQLLIALVTSNRERDPMRTRNKSRAGRRAQTARTNSSGLGEIDQEEMEDILLDFWEFVRFDIVLNQPHPESQFAFRLADHDNSGFISLNEIQTLLQDYADIDEKAHHMLNGTSKELQRVFGRDGSRVLTAKEFQLVAHDILPPTFCSDLEFLIQHMLNVHSWSPSMMDRSGRGMDTDYDQLAFVEPDGSPFLLGSQFTGSSRLRSRVVTSDDVHGGDEWEHRVSDGVRENEVGTRRLSGADLSWGHMVSIAVAGTVSRTLVAPLERLKILMQTQASPQRYVGLFSGLRRMRMDDAGVLRAWYRGNGLNVLRIAPNAAIQAFVVDRLHRRVHASSEHGWLGVAGVPRSVDVVIIGGVAGIASTIAMYPLEYVRGRVTVQRRGFEPYAGAIDAFRQIVQKEGLLSMYRGLTPAVVGGFTYVGLPFGMYELFLQPLLPRQNDGSGRPTATSMMVAGGLATVTGQVVAYPFDTVRRRMQVAGFAPGSLSPELGFGGTLAATVRGEGFRALFRGLLPNLVKAWPSTALSLAVYERVRGGYDVLKQVAEHDGRGARARA